MPEKFFIHPKPAPSRYRPIGKLGIVDWREDCSSCHNCVKKGCVYGFYRDEYDTLKNANEYLDYIYQCKGCLSCVQDCTKNLLARVVNPEYNRLGDEYYTPDILQVTWFQASTGAIPVSGAGYGGKFTGKGFDSMWTDMSEIVRPTRDGIHGREYINTGVELGRKLNHLTFVDGKLKVTPPPLEPIPMPLIFDIIPEQWSRGAVLESAIAAAQEIGIKTVVDAQNIPAKYKSDFRTIIPLQSGDSAISNSDFSNAPMIMLTNTPQMASQIADIKKKKPKQIIAIRVEANSTARDQVIQLVENGADVIHLVFNRHGRESNTKNPKHVRDVITDIHRSLVREGTRDHISLVAAGGVALAEHMAKAILCGADLVAIDIPIVLALECRLCHDCKTGGVCPIELENVEADYAKQRIINLLSAWHSQLLELMGASGIREARRLRGEAGRCMFFEDMEKDTFGRLFGKRLAKDGA